MKFLGRLGFVCRCRSVIVVIIFIFIIVIVFISFIDIFLGVLTALVTVNLICFSNSFLVIFISPSYSSSPSSFGYDDAGGGDIGVDDHVDPEAQSGFGEVVADAQRLVDAIQGWGGGGEEEEKGEHGNPSGLALDQLARQFLDAISTNQGHV